MVRFYFLFFINIVCEKFQDESGISKCKLLYIYLSIPEVQSIRPSKGSKSKHYLYFNFILSIHMHIHILFILKFIDTKLNYLC